MRIARYGSDEQPMCGWALAGCWWNLFISFDVREMRWWIASVKPIIVINRWSNVRAWILTCCKGWLLQLRTRFLEIVFEQLLRMRTFHSVCFFIACELLVFVRSVATFCEWCLIESLTFQICTHKSVIRYYYSVRSAETFIYCWQLVSMAVFCEEKKNAGRDGGDCHQPFKF